MQTITPSVIKPGRSKELILLVVSVVLTVIANITVSYQCAGYVTKDTIIILAIFVVMAFGMHMILRFKAPFSDQIIFPIVLTLNGMGIAIISQIEFAQIANGVASESGGALRQSVWGLLGLVVACLIVWFVQDHRILRKYTYISMVIAIVLLFMPLIPKIGVAINGSQIWVAFGPFSFQPSEFAKIFLVIFFAGYLVEHRSTLALAGKKVVGIQLPRIRDFGPIFVTWLLSMGVLIFEKDLGTGLLFFAIFIVMLYVATERVSWVVIGGIMFSLGALVCVKLFSHVMARVEIWLNPFDPDVYNRTVGGSGQLVQGLFGLGAGGLMGSGWGKGYPSLTPFANSDFVYSSLGEVLGLTGLLAVLVMYLLIVERGIRVSLGVRDGFGKLLAVGFAFSIVLQVFVVVGGVTRVIPLTGLVLPFIAKGGSSLLANWILIGLLLVVSSQSRRPFDIDKDKAPIDVSNSKPVQKMQNRLLRKENSGSDEKTGLTAVGNADSERNGTSRSSAGKAGLASGKKKGRHVAGEGRSSSNESGSASGAKMRSVGSSSTSVTGDASGEKDFESASASVSSGASNEVSGASSGVSGASNGVSGESDATSAYSAAIEAKSRELKGGEV